MEYDRLLDAQFLNKLVKRNIPIFFAPTPSTVIELEGKHKDKPIVNITHKVDSIENFINDRIPENANDVVWVHYGVYTYKDIIFIRGNLAK